MRAVYLDVRAMAQPEACIDQAATRIAPNSHITDEGTRDLLQRFINAFGEWVAMQRGNG